MTTLKIWASKGVKMIVVHCISTRSMVRMTTTALLCRSSISLKLINFKLKGGGTMLGQSRRDDGAGGSERKNRRKEKFKKEMCLYLHGSKCFSAERAVTNFSQHAYPLMDCIHTRQ